MRDLGLLTWEEAIRKMTSAPAQRLGLAAKGIVRPGLDADLVVFDPATVSDRATFDEPHQYPDGIEHVLVNGELVVSGGNHLGTLPRPRPQPAVVVSGEWLGGARHCRRRGNPHTSGAGRLLGGRVLFRRTVPHLSGSTVMMLTRLKWSAWVSAAAATSRPAVYSSPRLSAASLSAPSLTHHSYCEHRWLAYLLLTTAL